MKTFQICIALATIFIVFSCREAEKENPNVFTISGDIKGLDRNLFFTHPEREYTKEHFADSIIVADGKFTYTDSISELSLIQLYTKYSEDNPFLKMAEGGGYYPVKSSNLMLFAFPGADIHVEGKATDFLDAYPTGDDYNNSLEAINKIAYPNFNETVNLMLLSNYETDSLKAVSIMEKATALGKKGDEMRLKHIEDNPNSLGSLWYLQDMMMRRQINNEKAVELFNNISEDLKDISYYKAIASRVDGIKSTKEGMPVPVIKTTSTPDGEEFDIASLRGKYVLIDFWGIWCGPCVAEMPTVQEFQEKYKNNLVVLGINSGDTKDKIQNFLDENGYDWQQLMSVKDNSDDNFVTRFNVQGFPTKFIIDPQGKIVKRYLGSGEEAFTLLQELLN